MSAITKIKTGSKFEEIASYSRAVVVDNWILVSNTAGRNPDTGKIPEDIFEQVDQVFNNIERALAAVDATLADVVQSRVFIQNREDIHKVMTHIGTKYRGIDPTNTATCPPLGSDSYQVEVEVTAYRGASKADVNYLHLDK
ncbi:RidA family protein [Sessilibacter corallicola]|uniref:RidA family protein n=1 Tax=Sessilibacter corallicola TaxID=2904075 RepID=UPI001E2DF6D2|nr:RidA family protein [Sessilibacter corallicola]MCE2028891.1 RidA family protein [Sessilibacter corallicola]